MYLNSISKASRLTNPLFISDIHLTSYLSIDSSRFSSNFFRPFVDLKTLKRMVIYNVYHKLYLCTYM